MNCPECEKTTVEDDKYCEHCGIQLYSPICLSTWNECENIELY